MRATVMSGQRVAATFVAVPWVHDQFAEWLGVAPFPGTLNLKVTDPESLTEWQERSLGRGGLILEPGEEGYCPASYLPVIVEGTVRAGAVVPHVDGYPTDVVELVAGVRLRDHLGLEDGDEVSFEWDRALAD